MSKNTYEKLMNSSVDALVEQHDFNKATGHVSFNVEGIKPPKGITEDSMKLHTGFINDLGLQVEAATANLANTYHADNNELITLDGSLEWGGMTINSQHHLKQKVGEEDFFGVSTTATDFMYSEEATNWVDTQRDAAKATAKKLFG